MEDSRKREIQGNGLGLTIAQNLAHQLGGEIILDSEPNVKTTFTVKLQGQSKPPAKLVVLRYQTTLKK